MTVVVLGARGMLGHALVTMLEETGHDVVAVSRSGDVGSKPRGVDLRFSGALHKVLADVRPAWVVNAAGKLNEAVDADLADAIEVNSVLPHRLATWGAELDFTVVHVSTDCVFMGDSGPYAVTDIPDSTSAYGRTKTLGELDDSRNLTIRTSIIGPELSPTGIGLMLWLMRQSQKVQGWTESRWTGLTTIELSRVILERIDGALAETGIWQCVPDSSLSKFELVNLMNERVRTTPLDVEAVPGHVSDKSLINDRPTIRAIPDYDSMMVDVRAWIDAHPQLYRGTPFSP